MLEWSLYGVVIGPLFIHSLPLTVPTFTVYSIIKSL
jgi:hypothetical protein